jgi:hypothetical protein
LEYGASAPKVFIDDAQFKDLWLEPHRYYLLAFRSDRTGSAALQRRVRRAQTRFFFLPYTRA